MQCVQKTWRERWKKCNVWTDCTSKCKNYKFWAKTTAEPSHSRCGFLPKVFFLLSWFPVVRLDYRIFLTCFLSWERFGPEITDRKQKQVSGVSHHVKGNSIFSSSNLVPGATPWICDICFTLRKKNFWGGEKCDNPVENKWEPDYETTSFFIRSNPTTISSSAFYAIQNQRKYLWKRPLPPSSFTDWLVWVFVFWLFFFAVISFHFLL